MNHLQVEDSVKESFCAGFPDDGEGDITPVARAVRQAAPREYHSFVGGVDVPSDNGVYCMTARAMLNDVFATLRAKRALERGKGIREIQMCSPAARWPTARPPGRR